MPTVALACVAALLAGPSAALKAKIVDRVGEVLKEKAFVPGADFSSWKTVAQRRKKAFDAAQTPEAFASELNQAFAAYGVSHLALAPPGLHMGSKIETFGFVAREDKGKSVVTRVFDGTEAERIGLRPGTVLASYVFPDYPKTDRVQVGFDDGSHVVRTSILTKERIVPKEKPQLLWLAEDAFVLRVPTFHEGYDDAAVERFVATSQKVPNLVIDLRGNSGGYGIAGARFLQRFLPAGTPVGFAVTQETLRAYVRQTGGDPNDRAAVMRWLPDAKKSLPANAAVRYEGRLAVLIDEGTGSAAELVAAALRDGASAAILGAPSAGQALVMGTAPLPGGYVLYYPRSDWWTAKGERLEGRPIVPDVMVAKDSEEAGPVPYPLRRKALEWLHAHPSTSS